MAHIYVCGIVEMADHVAARRPDRLISLVSEREQPPTPDGIRPEYHLRLPMDDVEVATLSGAPRANQIAALIAFCRQSPASASILIHCSAGVSRSPAAALVAMVAEATGKEHTAASVLDRAAPYASPNTLMIRLGDQLLGCEGRLIAAAATVGTADAVPTFDLVILPRHVR